MWLLLQARVPNYTPSASTQFVKTTPVADSSVNCVRPSSDANQVLVGSSRQCKAVFL